MKKNYYLAAFRNDDGKNYAFVIKAESCYNLLSELKIKNIVAANICDSKKEAVELASRWNADFRNNGTALFDRDYGVRII